jgi:hypothetical protein
LRRQWARLEDDIKGFSALGVEPIAPATQASGFAVDADQLATAVRVVAGVWLAYPL